LTGVPRSLPTVILTAAVMSGCASGPLTRTSRAHRPQGDAAQASSDRATATSPERRESPQAAATPPRAPTATTIEGSDAALAAALVRAGTDPTAQNLDRVAERYFGWGVLDTALEFYTRALAVDRSDAVAYEHLGRIWRDWGFFERAMAAASKAVYYAPSSASAYNTLATIMQAVGDRRNARWAYEESLKRDPWASYALTNLCYVSFLDGEMDRATAQCEEALKMEPALASAHNNLALIFAARGRMDLAQRELSAAGDPASAQFNLGVIFMAQRDFGRAADAFEIASASRPLFRAADQRARQARARAQD